MKLFFSLTRALGLVFFTSPAPFFRISREQIRSSSLKIIL